VREAVKLAPGSAARYVLEIVRTFLPQLSDDFAFEACNQFLDTIMKKSPEAVKLRDELLLDWAVRLTLDIEFQNAPIDALRCLHAAEKVNLLARESFEIYLTRIDIDLTINILRLASVSKFAPLLQDLVRTKCESLTKIEFMGLNGLSESVMKDFWELCPNLTSVAFIRCNVTDESLEYMSTKVSKKSFTSLLLPGCIHLRANYLNSVSKNLESLRILNLAVCFVSDENLKALAHYCPALERLSLNKTRVSGEALLPVIKGAKNLQVLDIGGCGNITEKFFTSLSVMQNLQTLIISASAQLTNKAIGYIVKIPKLSLLDISFCDKIDEKGILLLFKAEMLAEVFLKGAQGRIEEKTQKKLQQTFRQVYFDLSFNEKFLEVRPKSPRVASPRAENLYYDLQLDDVVVAPRKMKSPRDQRPSLHRLSTAPLSARKSTSTVALEEEDIVFEDEEKVERPSTFRLSLLKKKATRRSSMERSKDK
jgi:hypothetical protein